MEDNNTANNPEQNEPAANPYSAKAVKQALGRKRTGELLILSPMIRYPQSIRVSGAFQTSFYTEVP